MASNLNGRNGEKKQRNQRLVKVELRINSTLDVWITTKVETGFCGFVERAPTIRLERKMFG
jgi:hypothetical protein